MADAPLADAPLGPLGDVHPDHVHVVPVPPDEERLAADADAAGVGQTVHGSRLRGEAHYCEVSIRIESQIDSHVCCTLHNTIGIQWPDDSQSFYFLYREINALQDS